MLRMRVEAAASARCARSAPPVILPASTTCRNRLRSLKSKRMASFGFGEGKLREKPIVGQVLESHIREERKQERWFTLRGCGGVPFAVGNGLGSGRRGNGEVHGGHQSTGRAAALSA